MPQRQLRSVSAGLLSSAKFWAHSLPILVLCSLRDLKATATCFQIFGQLRVGTVSEHSRSPVPISHWQKNNNDCIVSSVMWLATSAGIATKCSPLASVVSCMMFATVGKTWFEQLCWWRVNSCHQGWLLPEWICCDSCDCSPNAADSPLVTAPCDCSQALPGAELWTWSTRGTESDWSHSTAVVGFLFQPMADGTHNSVRQQSRHHFLWNARWEVHPFSVGESSKQVSLNQWHSSVDLEFVQRVHSSWHVSCGTMHVTEITQIRNPCHLGVESRALPAPFVVVWEWWGCKVFHDLQSTFPKCLPRFFFLTKNNNKNKVFAHKSSMPLCSMDSMHVWLWTEKLNQRRTRTNNMNISCHCVKAGIRRWSKTRSCRIGDNEPCIHLKLKDLIAFVNKDPKWTLLKEWGPLMDSCTWEDQNDAGAMCSKPQKRTLGSCFPHLCSPEGACPFQACLWFKFPQQHWLDRLLQGHQKTDSQGSCGTDPLGQTVEMTSHINSKETLQSCNAVLIVLNRAPISWHSKKQFGLLLENLEFGCRSNSNENHTRHCGQKSAHTFTVQVLTNEAVNGIDWKTALQARNDGHSNWWSGHVMSIPTICQLWGTRASQSLHSRRSQIWFRFAVCGLVMANIVSVQHEPADANQVRFKEDGAHAMRCVLTFSWLFVLLHFIFHRFDALNHASARASSSLHQICTLRQNWKFVCFT